MSLLTTTTRPAGTGGIDLSGIDLAQAIFNATGGGYGAPGTRQPVAEAGPSKLPDWNTNGGTGPVADQFDFSQPPVDKAALIKLLAEPEGGTPLPDPFGEEAPVFRNGGPEGTGIVVAVAAVVVVAVLLWAADDLSDGAICDFLGWEHDGYRDPDADAGSLAAPAKMMADLLGKAGISGLDPQSVQITDILGKLSDNAGKVADLVGRLQDAGKSGDTGTFADALAELKQLAGLDDAAFDAANPSMLVLDGVFEAFGIVGGLDGVATDRAVQQSDTANAGVLIDVAAWVSSWDYYIA